MIGNIYIKGQIGNTYDNDGNVVVRGVTLLDILDQFTDLPSDRSATYFHLENSPGGYVTTGNDIIEFISNVPNAFVVAHGSIASITTKIFCAVPVENRMVEEGLEFMIHNPWIDGVSGDASELRAAADDVEKHEIELEAFYSKATGLDKSTLSNLMKNETYLTAEQCVKFGFASSILKKEKTRVLALNYNQNEIEMNKEQKTVAESIMAKLGYVKAPKTNDEGRKVLAVMTVTDKGTLDSEFETLEENDAVTIDGEPAPSGTYVAEDGRIIEVVDGIAVKITVEGEGEDDTEALKARIAELESEVEASKATTETLEADKLALEEKIEASDKNAKEVLAQLEVLAEMESNGEPIEKTPRFNRKQTEQPKRSVHEIMKNAKNRNKK
jgi:ATP-dependent protease ClpP protease subunit